MFVETYYKTYLGYCKSIYIINTKILRFGIQDSKVLVQNKHLFLLNYFNLFLKTYDLVFYVYSPNVTNVTNVINVTNTMF
jgi:hypothetical protein